MPSNLAEFKFYIYLKEKTHCRCIIEAGYLLGNLQLLEYNNDPQWHPSSWWWTSMPELTVKCWNRFAQSTTFVWQLAFRLTGLEFARFVNMPMPKEPPCDKTNKVSVRPAKTQISLGIRPDWSESSLSAWRKLATHWAHSEDSDQTGRVPRLIWVLAGHTATLLVLSRGGSNIVCFV